MTYVMKSALLAAGTIFLAGTASAQTVGLATLPVGAINNLTTQILAKVSQAHTDLKIRVLPFRGGAAINAAVNAKRAEFGISDVAALTAGLQGKDEFSKRPTPNLRVIFNLRPLTVGFFVKKDSAIKTIGDLKGMRFPTKWSAFPNAIHLANGLFATAGLSLNDVKGVPVTNIIRAADDFKAGKLDGGFFAVGAPKMAEVNSAVGGIRWLSIPNTPQAIAGMKSIRPDYYLQTVKPNPINAGITGPTNVLGVDLVIFAGTHVADDVVEKFVASIHPNKAELVKGHPLFRSFNPKTMAKQYAVARYHPGAISFYKKAGMWTGK